MQSSKAPKKTSKIADKPVIAAASEPGADNKGAAKPRGARSSKKKMESGDAQSIVKHHHKLSSTVVSEPVNVSAAPEVGKTFAALAGASAGTTERHADSPTRVIHHADIANLAYSYWVERGYGSGSPEEDWLRAERELAGLR